MECLLIFDHLNDIIYTKYNVVFLDHIRDVAKLQGLLPEASNDDNLDDNVIIQMFSPIVASHRIMSCQFGNSYTSIQCSEGLDMHFEQYMGYLFVAIGSEDSSYMKRYINICITLVRYLCGPDVYQLKAFSHKTELVSSLINSWTNLYKSDQAINVEAVEQLLVNSDLSVATIKALQESVEKMIVSKMDCSNKVHALVLVGNKFLSLYSSPNAKELSASDILFGIILNNSLNNDSSTDNGEETTDSCNVTKDSHGETKDYREDIDSFQVLLAGSDQSPKCFPHVIHCIQLSKNISLLYFLEVGNAAISASLYETFSHLHTLQLVQNQREKSVLQPAFENLELAHKKLNDSLKKTKNSQIDAVNKLINKKWDVIKKKYQEFFKSGSDEALLRAETLCLAFLENLNDLLKLTSVDEHIVKSTQINALKASEIVKEGFVAFNDFFKAKSIRNFSLGSSLTMHKYLEEFPGLVHFLYIDRNSHRLTCPTLQYDGDDNIPGRKIAFMINFARSHLEDQGTMSLMWKDTLFSYAYFLWFEDSSGAPLKPTALPTAQLPLSGILVEDFYRKLKEICFPKLAPGKIRCYELFCVHLGLVTASCVLEQTRRLSATIWDIRGHPSHPIDLL